MWFSLSSPYSWHGQNICWLRSTSIEDKRVVVCLPFVDAKIQTIKRCTKWQMKIAFQCFLHYVSICQTESEALKHFMLGLKNMAQVREIFPRQNSNGPNQFFKSLSSLLPAPSIFIFPSSARLQPSHLQLIFLLLLSLLQSLKIRQK